MDSLFPSVGNKRLATCLERRRFSRRAEAIPNRESAVEVAYWCRYCGGWHLGTEKPKWSALKPSRARKEKPVDVKLPPPKKVKRRGKSSGPWPEKREAVFWRDNHTCVYCGSKENLTIDHALPVSRGGGNLMGNLLTACQWCNGKKGSRTVEEFLADPAVRSQAVAKNLKIVSWIERSLMPRLESVSGYHFGREHPWSDKAQNMDQPKWAR